jgi:hypothetical protein
LLIADESEDFSLFLLLIRRAANDPLLEVVETKVSAGAAIDVVDLAGR